MSKGSSDHLSVVEQWEKEGRTPQDILRKYCPKDPRLTLAHVAAYYDPQGDSTLRAEMFEMLRAQAGLGANGKPQAIGDVEVPKVVVAAPSVSAPAGTGTTNGKEKRSRKRNKSSKEE